MIKTPVFFFFLFFLFSLAPSRAQIRTLDGNLITEANMDRFLDKQMSEIGIPGLSIAIINNGKIVYQRSLGVSDTDTKSSLNNNSIFEAASLSKTMFTYFVMRMVDKGVLDLDKPLYQYMSYPDIAKDERYKLITARMVLSHTSGLPNWRDLGRADTSLHVAPGDLYLNFVPGTKFSYSGEGYYFLAQVLAHLSRGNLQTLDPLFQEEVSKPLGLAHAWFSSNTFITRHKVTGYKKGKALKKWPGALKKSDSTWFGAAGALHTEAHSYARFLIALMEGKGLSKTSAAEFFKQQIQLPANEDHDGETGWGLGIAIVPAPYRTDYDHQGNNGNFQSYFRINKEQKSGYVVFISCDRYPEFSEKLNHFFLTGKVL